MAKSARLTEEKVARLQSPATGEVTIWDPSLPRFGVRMRAGGATKTFVLKYRNAAGQQKKLTLGNWPALGVDAARRLARQKLGEVECGNDPAAERKADREAKTVRDLAAAYMVAKAGVKRPSSLYDDRANWDKIIVPKVGRRRVRDVTAREVEELHRSLAATPIRANRVLSLLSHAFRLAVRWDWRSDNPVTGIERYPEGKRERYLTPDELRRLTEALNDYPDRRSANAVRLLLLTGARRGEVLGATWDMFDLQAGVWTKPSTHTKQKRPHRVPLSAPARALLAAMREECDRAPVRSRYLFPGDVEERPLRDIRRPWKKILNSAGIADLRRHDLRHSYASLLAGSGLSLPIIGALLGHTTPQTTARYAHLLDDPLRAATERVGALVENAGKRVGAEVVPLRPTGS